MSKKYYGVIPPIVTPVDEHERVDEKGFRQLLRYCIDVGMHGIFVAGTNGESLGLTQAERDRAISIALDECGGKVPVLCGVMDSSTRRVIENIKRLEQMGGTAAVVTPVFYAKHAGSGEFIRHFEAISKNTACDLFIYNIPPYTGAALKPSDVYQIAEMEHVVGYKDSGGNFSEFSQCLQHFDGTDFVLLQGSSVLGGASMLAGADGMIPSLAPLFPEIYLGVYEAGKRGDLTALKHYNGLLYQAQALLGMSKSGLAANKCALSLLGYTSKRVIAPTEPVKQEEKNAMRLRARQICQTAGLPCRIAP